MRRRFSNIEKEYVDLGLPSGLKWLKCNVEATNPEDIGQYLNYDEVINLKSNFRVPTKNEMEELITTCSWQWVTQNGTKGYKIIGPNNNSIFLPAGGYKYRSSVYDLNYGGYYWSYTSYNSIYSYYMYLDNNNKYTSTDYDDMSFSVRLVCND